LVNTHSVVAWYGGSFDPPHVGHQQIVSHLLSLTWIDRVIVTPAWLNPFKSHTLASPQQRLEWCRTVFADPNVIIDPGEIDAGMSVYTAHTIERLRQTYDVRYLVIGADNLSSIENWHAFEYLNTTLTWLVFEREGHEEGYEKLKNYQRFALDAPISSSMIRETRDVQYVDKNIAHRVQKLLTKGNT
jgi:nicotinate-nucleotide adenylyltransferase